MPSRATLVLSALSVPLLVVSSLTAATAATAAPPALATLDLATVNAKGLTVDPLTAEDLTCLAGAPVADLSLQQLDALAPGDLAPQDVAPCLGPADLVPAPAPSPTPAPSPGPPPPHAASGALTWAPPALVDPVELTLTERRPFVLLDDARDYVLRVDGGRITLRPGQKAGAFGGRNVVWVGGEINAPGNDRPIKLDRQKGSFHLEGVHITGRDLHEGIDIDERRGATVTIQNVLVDKVSGSIHGFHADVLQTWAGPGRLRIDRLEGTTNYQGMMIDTKGLGDATTSEFDFRNVVLRYDPAGNKGVDKAYLIRRTDEGGDWPLRGTDNVLVHPTKVKDRLVAGPGDWEGFDVARSAPSPLIGTPGPGYVSPGYAG